MRQMGRAIGYVAGRVTGGSARAGCNASLQETSSCGFAGQKSSKGETHVVRAGRVVRSDHVVSAVPVSRPSGEFAPAGRPEQSITILSLPLNALTTEHYQAVGN